MIEVLQYISIMGQRIRSFEFASPRVDKNSVRAKSYPTHGLTSDNSTERSIKIYLPFSSKHIRVFVRE